MPSLDCHFQTVDFRLMTASVFHPQNVLMADLEPVVSLSATVKMQQKCARSLTAHVSQDAQMDTLEMDV